MKALPSYFSVGDGPAVVLLHCTMSSKNQWRALAAELESRYRVVALDLYGYGDTPMPANTADFTLLDEADLVAALLDQILPPEEAVHLVGHSYGGAVALHFCHSFPSRVRSLTAFEPVAFHLLSGDDPALAGVREMMAQLNALMEAGLPGEAVRVFLDFWSGPGTFASYPPRLQKDFTARAEKLLLDFRALTHTAVTAEDYRNLPLPVTLLAGRSSKAPALRVSEVLAEILPNCSRVWVDTGHMGPLTDPDAVNVIIKEALAASN
jgi:pimeloyl-ACP methyl ester carboxylesterase